MIHSRRAGHIVRVKDLDGKRVTSGRGEGESTLNELHCARIGNSLANLPHCAHCICGLYVSFPQLPRLIKIKVKNHRQLRVEGAGGRGREREGGGRRPARYCRQSNWVSSGVGSRMGRWKFLAVQTEEVQ